jgi:hypothetical protein
MAARFQAKSKKNIGEGSASGGIGGALLLTSCARSEEPKLVSQKHEILARLKAKSNQCTPRPVFLRVCRHVTSKQHFRSFFFAP